MATWRRGKFSIITAVIQIAFLVLFILFVKYDKTADASDSSNSRDLPAGESDPAMVKVDQFYPMFQDVHVMMFIGFGFLMTFLKRYGYGSVGLNFLIACIVLQWSTLMSGFLHLEDGKILLTLETLLFSDFASAAVLISFGAVLGKASPTQLVIMTLLEIPIFQVNEWLGLKHFGAVDVGGSMFVHIFGAYFGIAVAKMINVGAIYKSPGKEKQGSHYHSDLFSMIGTIFLWLFWPSFNSAVAAPGDDQQRAIINTYYTLAACTVTTFVLCSLLDKEDKFEMEYIQNSTLAGGVAVGTMADMMIQPWGAMLIGIVAAIVSVLGFRFISSFLSDKLHIHDTCGVNNLHGMPGIIAAVGGIIAAYIASEDDYGLSLYQIFPHRAPEKGTIELANIQGNFSAIEAGDNWSSGRQAAMQAAALGTTLGMAIVGGVITGLILKLPIWNQPKDSDEVFEDEPFWELPEEGYPHIFIDGEMLPNNKYDAPMVPITSSHQNGVEISIQNDQNTKI